MGFCHPLHPSAFQPSAALPVPKGAPGSPHAAIRALRRPPPGSAQSPLRPAPLASKAAADRRPCSPPPGPSPGLAVRTPCRNGPSTCSRPRLSRSTLPPGAQLSTAPCGCRYPTQARGRHCRVFLFLCSLNVWPSVRHRDACRLGLCPDRPHIPQTQTVTSVRTAQKSRL